MKLEELLKRAHDGQININNDMLSEAAALNDAAARETAVREVARLLTSFEATLSHKVKLLKHTRQQERKQASEVKKIDRAIRYFGESCNPLPVFSALGDHYGIECFCSTTGIDKPEDDSEAYRVPDDFE